MTRLQTYILNEEKKFTEIISMVQKNCQPYIKELSKGNINLLWRGSRRRINDIDEVKTRLKNRGPQDTPSEIHNHMNRLFKNRFKWKVRNGVFATGKYSTTRNYGIGYMFFPIGKFEFVWSPDVKDFYTKIDSENNDINDDSINDNCYIVYDSEEYFSWNDLKSEYEDEYGEDEKGHWEYDGKEVKSSNPNDIVDELGLDYEEEYDDDLLEWVPDMSYDEYEHKLYTDREEKRDQFFQDLADLYTNKNLVKAIKSGNEIMFNCKSYYLIHEKHAMSMKEVLEGKYTGR